MSRIHPEENKRHDLSMVDDADVRPSVLTVWKRSSMSFQGTDGFTVFDQRGRLVFRVDNYSRTTGYAADGNVVVLMDRAGNALLTLKPQVLSMQYQWNAYKGEDGCAAKSKVFSMRRLSGFFHSGKDKAEVVMGMGGSGKQGETADFQIEGSFRTRDCKIIAANGQVVAKIARKRVNTTILLSDDVFSLIIQPGVDTALVMAFLIILDRISSRTYCPVLCS